MQFDENDANVKDAAQAKIRQDKKSFNTNVKQFLVKFRQTRSAFNGHGGKDLGIPETKITQPVHPKTQEALHQLLDEFGKIVSYADFIIDEQNAYAATKTQKQASLNVEASNRFTRFLSYLASPFDRREIKKQRIDLLKALAECFYSLLDVESFVVGSGNESLYSASQSLSLFERNYKYAISIFIAFNQDVKGHLKENIGDSIYNEDELNAIIQDFEFAKSLKSIVLPHYFKRFLSLHSKIANAEDPKKKDELFQEIKRYYKELLDYCNFTLKANASSFEELSRSISETFDNATLTRIADDFNAGQEAGIFQQKHLRKFIDLYGNIENAKDLLSKNEALEKLKQFYDNIIKEYQGIYAGTLKISFDTFADLADKLNERNKSKISSAADNFITRWLKRQKHKISPFDKTSAMRLEIYKHIKNIKTTLNSMMDILESDFDLDKIKNGFASIQEDFMKMRQLFSSIEVLYRGELMSAPYLKMLEQGELPAKNLSKEELALLTKRLKSKDIRDLVQQYKKK